MRPDYIYLIRHGESQGNINWDAYKDTPDWKLHLTEKGREQANTATAELYNLIGSWEPPIRLYCSPWIRARETAEPIIKSFYNVWYREDPRLREQEWGNYQEEHLAKKIDNERDRFGTFFYRMPYGESGADVYDRVSTFLETLHRDFKHSLASHIVIVSHGLTIRIFLMRWFHWTVEQYEKLANPHNCQIIVVKKKENQKYELITPLRKK